MYRLGVDIVRPRVPYVEPEHRDALSIEDCVAFLRDYPNVFDVSTVRRLVDHVLLLEERSLRAVELTKVIIDYEKDEDRPSAHCMRRSCEDLLRVLRGDEE